MNKPDLVELFNHLNSKHFNNVIHSIPVVWNTRMRTTAGYCRFKRQLHGVVPTQIDLNKRLFHNLNWDLSKIERTLVHEMVHAYLAQEFNDTKHSKRFQMKMVEITGEFKNHRCHDYDVSELQEKRKVVIKCGNCGVIGRRSRMPKKSLGYHCKKCKGPVFFLKDRGVEVKKEIKLF